MSQVDNDLAMAVFSRHPRTFEAIVIESVEIKMVWYHNHSSILFKTALRKGLELRVDLYRVVVEAVHSFKA